MMFFVRFVKQSKNQPRGLKYAIVFCINFGDRLSDIFCMQRVYHAGNYYVGCVFSVPVRTIFDPHPDAGCSCIALTPDAKFLATISAGQQQVLTLSAMY